MKKEVMEIIAKNNGEVKGTIQGYAIVNFNSGDEKEMLNMAAAVIIHNQPIIVTGSVYNTWSKEVQEFTLWHEVGHLILQHHNSTDKARNEYEADAYAVEHVGSNVAISALQQIQLDINKIDYISKEGADSMCKAIELRKETIKDKDMSLNRDLLSKINKLEDKGYKITISDAGVYGTNPYNEEVQLLAYADMLIIKGGK